MSGERNFIEQIKAPIFLKTVLPIEIMQELQSNLEETENLRVLKDDFWFFLKNRPIHFHVNSTSVIRVGVGNLWPTGQDPAHNFCDVEDDRIFL